MDRAQRATAREGALAVRVTHRAFPGLALASVTLWGWGAGCASPGMPPGGPTDKFAPELVKVSPDSDARNLGSCARSCSPSTKS